MGFHANLTDSDIHVPYRWVWADSTERNAETVAATDVGKIGIQVDTYETYYLVDTTPTWEMIGGTGNAHIVEDAVTNAVTDVVTITHTSTATVAAGFGTGVSIEAENSAGSTIQIGQLAWKFDGDGNAIVSIGGWDSVNTSLNQSFLARKGYGYSTVADTSAYIGVGSVDIQQARANANQTAEGEYSSVLGGKHNRILTTGGYSVIGGGLGNYLSGKKYSAILTGFYNYIVGSSNHSVIVSGSVNRIAGSPFTAILTGLRNRIEGAGRDHSAILTGKRVIVNTTGVVAAGNENVFDVDGASQGKIQVLRSEQITHSTTAWDTISSGIPVEVDSAFVFHILLVGLDSGATTRQGYEITGMIVNDGGTTTLLASNVTTIFETTATYDAQVVANDTLDTLEIQVQDSAGGGGTLRWVASVRTVETLFA